MQEHYSKESKIEFTDRMSKQLEKLELNHAEKNLVQKYFLTIYASSVRNAIKYRK
jgi:hypothetical protein